MQIEAGGQARRLAVQVSQLAGDVRGLAASAQAAEGVDWASTAAEDYRRSLAADCAAVRQAAELLDRAAAAVARHAQAVDDAVDSVADGAVGALGSAARWLL